MGNPSQSYGASPAISDYTKHRWTCSASTPARQAGRYSIYLPQRDGRQHTVKRAWQCCAAVQHFNHIFANFLPSITATLTNSVSMHRLLTDVTVFDCYVSLQSADLCHVKLHLFIIVIIFGPVGSLFFCGACVRLNMLSMLIPLLIASGHDAQWLLSAQISNRNQVQLSPTFRLKFPPLLNSSSPPPFGFFFRGKFC